jgi:general secretion pathway protein G
MEQAEGRTQNAEGQTAAGPMDRLRRSLRLPAAVRLLPAGASGFTLLELMIVISIIIVLAVIVLPQYQRTVQQARESVLRDDLFQMRKMIDQYAADKGKLPESPQDLVTAGYLREIPRDPMTGSDDWRWDTGPDPNSAEGGSGITDVHSISSDQALDGTTYDQW